MRNTPFFKNLKEVEKIVKDWPEWKKHPFGRVVKRMIENKGEEYDTEKHVGVTVAGRE